MHEVLQFEGHSGLRVNCGGAVLCCAVLLMDSMTRIHTRDIRDPRCDICDNPNVLCLGLGPSAPQ